MIFTVITVPVFQCLFCRHSRPVTFRNTTFFILAYALVTGITTLSAHCSQGTQVSILAKAEAFYCHHKKYTDKEFLSRILCLLALLLCLLAFQSFLYRHYRRIA